MTDHIEDHAKPEQRLHDYLSALPYRIASDHDTLLTADLPVFLVRLGHADATVFFEFLVDFSTPIVADAMVADDRSEQPQLFVHVKTARIMVHDPETLWNGVRVAYTPAVEGAGALLVLFSPLYLGIAGTGLERWYRLASLTREQSAEIYALLKPADPTFEPDEPTVTAPPEETFAYD